MKKIILSFLILFSFSISADEAYHYYVNLKAITNDKVNVQLTVPTFTNTEVEFTFPAMVPGTYEVYNFGRFISNLKAFGKNNTFISIKKIDINTYKISSANLLEKITYDVDDTWDKCDLPGTKENIIFEPGGTNFEVEKNFSINTHSMFGYFKGFTNRNFIIEFEKPLGFYPATGLSTIKIGTLKDEISVFDYHDLVDAPIVYTIPDTTTLKVGNTDVLVSCYSPNKKINSRFIAATLYELLNVQKAYLGGELPVSKYAFLFYFMDGQSLSGSNGALEHSYSSFYVMPEYDSTALKQQLRDVAAHEFFHIVTPLNIHAKQIGDFDFNNPQMSEHLWLYEGMTEYAAHHAQAKGGLTNVDILLNTMMEKYQNSINGFNDTMSFTHMSKNVLNPKIHKQYGNVYEKGAVIGMCLDILLRDLTYGNYGTQNLMKDLASKYGKNKSFNDADLFNDIEKFTYPEIGTFLRKHVGGNDPLPIVEVLSKIGINFLKENESYEFSFGSPDLNYNEKTKRLYVLNTTGLDEIGKLLGFKKGDELKSLNGKEIKIEQAREIFSDFYANNKEGEKIIFEVYRPKKLRKKKYSILTLSTPSKKVKVVRENQLKLQTNLTEKQKLVLKSWVGF